MPRTGRTDGDNASCEVNSHSAPRESSHPKWNASEFQCSICYELLLNPVVGSCGHDFCKHCIEEWKVSRQLVGQAVVCPICRAVLLPSVDQSFGVCIRLRETIEKLFPDQVANRRRLAGLAAKSRKCFNDSCPAGLPLSASPTISSTTSSSTSSDTSAVTATTTATTTTTTTGTGTTSHGATSDGSPRPQPTASGGAPGPPLPPYAFLDLDLLSRAAEQYRELSMLVSAITSVPAPPDAVVQAFTEAAASMADQASVAAAAGQQRQGAGVTAVAAVPLPPQQAAELARLFLSSGAALTSTAAAAAAQQQQNTQSPAVFGPYSAHAYQQQQPHPYAVYGYVPHHFAHHRQDSGPYGMDPAMAASAAAAVATMCPADASNSAALAAQLALGSVPGGRGGGSASSVRSGGSGSGSVASGGGGGFLEAALTLLTSAAATSNAAGQLRTLVTALHHQHQEQQSAGEGGGYGAAGGEDDRARQPQTAASPGAADDALRATAHTVQQLTAEAAAMSQVLRAHHQQQLQAHMQAAAQAQQQQHHHQQQQQYQYAMASAAAVQAAAAQAQAQHLGGHYRGVLAAAAQPAPVALLAWGSPPAAPASPFFIVPAVPQLQALMPGFAAASTPTPTAGQPYVPLAFHPASYALPTPAAGVATVVTAPAAASAVGGEVLGHPPTGQMCVAPAAQGRAFSQQAQAAAVAGNAAYGSSAGSLGSGPGGVGVAALHGLVRDAMDVGPAAAVTPHQGLYPHNQHQPHHHVLYQHPHH